MSFKVYTGSVAYSQLIPVIRQKIRMIGVDTPETVHPSKEVEYFGRDTSGFTKTRLPGKAVYQAFDWDLRDKYDRLARLSKG